MRLRRLQDVPRSRWTLRRTFISQVRPLLPISLSRRSRDRASASGLSARAGTAPDVFVTKLNAAGTAIVFSTYLGGDGADTTAGVAVDSAFNVVVAGTTTSSNFPDSAVRHFKATPASVGRARVCQRTGRDWTHSDLLDLSFRKRCRIRSWARGGLQEQDLCDWHHHIHQPAGRDPFVSRYAGRDSGRFAGHDASSS